MAPHFASTTCANRNHVPYVHTTCTVTIEIYVVRGPSVEQTQETGNHRRTHGETEREMERRREDGETERETETQVNVLLALGVPQKILAATRFSFGGTNGLMLGRRGWFDAGLKDWFDAGYKGII